ncbi:ATP-binding cassette domain-containing protein [Lagierella massiliensis]|uniref:ATP-binding cassette domain-containing protein n=1 Tax=Lagierella massiliensis TaxID=1689303 RepID=UPI0006D83DEB|nr:ATP-binding cassette domain-containing protein [Lagierella massiliensis]
MLDNQIILKTEHLNKEFVSKKQRTKAVNNLSFQLRRGETYGLVGESGCGKTTTGRLIIKLLQADSGKIFFNNIDISDMSTKEFRKMRSSIQMIFQDPFASLNPRMKIRKLLEEAVASRKHIEEKVEDIIEELIISVGLDVKDLDKYPHEFSGGQRQRIVIARAIATQPELIICDEPVSALDLLVQGQILKLLKDLQKKYNFTYIFISHNLSVVRYMSDRIAVMCMGKIVEEGTTEEIFANPSHIYTKLLLESIPTINEGNEGREYEKSYYDNKYNEAIENVRLKSDKRIYLSETHYTLQNI